MTDKETDLKITLKQLKARKKVLKEMLEFGKNDNVTVWCEIENFDISETERIIIDFSYLKVALLSELNAVNKTLKHLETFKK